MKNKKQIDWAVISRKAIMTVSCMALLSLTACEGMSERLSRINKEPPLAKIENPYHQKGYQPVSLPMPPQELANNQPNSLWEPARQTFFKDQRAHKVGDILTILIDINDQGNLTNETKTTRSNTEDQGLPNFLGLESKLKNVFPSAIDPANLVTMNSDQEKDGKGTMKRQEQIQLKLAAIVTQVLPNGNFVIKGRQQVRVNFELRDLLLDGVIRPEDILNNNSISYEKIAEARIAYGGKGTMSDIQNSRWGDQVFDAVFPF
jgi:flagellar L-ring protein precursor FlgH